jgi:hypothetical protein
MVDNILYNNVPPAVQQLFYNTNELVFFNSDKNLVYSRFSKQVNNLISEMPAILKDNNTWSEYERHPDLKNKKYTKLQIFFNELCEIQKGL